jgi:sulfatase maturation enzyme AslB (radical SAM superfamily)
MKPLNQNKMKTAVEWLVEQMKTYNMTVSVHNTSHENVMDFYKAIEQAKEMENQRLKDAYQQGYNNAYFNNPLSKEQYYNETFKSE